MRKSKPSAIQEKPAATDYDRVVRLMTDPKLSKLKAALGKTHAMDLLFALYIGKARHVDIEPYFRQFGISISDYPYYSRLKTFVKVGIAQQVRIDSLRNYYVITEFGKKVAEQFIKFFDELEG